MASVPLPSLLSAGLSQQTEIVTQLSRIVLNSDAVTEEQKPAIQDLVQKNKDLTQSISIQTNYRLADDQGLETFVDTDNLISPLYEELADNLVHSISDTQCKHLQHFSADDHVGVALDENVEKFAVELLLMKMSKNFFLLLLRLPARTISVTDAQKT